jgi:hypothetical protein
LAEVLLALIPVRQVVLEVHRFSSDLQETVVEGEVEQEEMARVLVGAVEVEPKMVIKQVQVEIKDIAGDKVTMVVLVVLGVALVAAEWEAPEVMVLREVQVEVVRV